MSITLEKNTDIQHVGTVTLSLGGTPYLGTDLAVQKSDGVETIFTDTTSAIDRHRTIRLGSSQIPNIYAGTDVDKPYRANSTQGRQVLATIKDVWSLTDSDKPDFRIDLPVSCNITLKIPLCEYITESDVLGLLTDTVCSLYRGQTSGSAALPLIDSLFRGATNPKGL